MQKGKAGPLSYRGQNAGLGFYREEVSERHLVGRQREEGWGREDWKVRDCNP